MAKIKVKLSNISRYKNIVDNHYSHYLELESAYNALSTQFSCETSKYEIYDKLYKIEKAMDEAAIVIFVFSQMTIEAFCNSYLLKFYRKRDLKKPTFCFRKKLKKTIVSLLKESNIKISEDDAHNYYGADIDNLLNIRKKQVHRFPVIINLELDSNKKFEKDSKFAAKEIEQQSLRRFKKEDVDNAATAYQKLIDKLKVEGVDFSVLDFEY